MYLDKGLHKDSKEIYQPENTWFDANNLMFDDDQAVLTQENGNIEHCFNLPANKSIIGSVELNEDLYIFLHDDSGSTDEIGRINKSGHYDVLFSSTSLNFNTNYKIKCKILDSRIVIFTDNINPLRYLNINNLPDTVEELELVSPKTGSNVKTTSVSINGGNLPEGVYSVFFRYINKNGVKTNILNNEVNSLILCSAVYYYTGGNATRAGSNIASSNKAIKTTFTSLNTNYEEVEVILVGVVNEQITAKSVFTQKISSSSDVIVISDFEGDEVDLIDLFLDKERVRLDDIEAFENTIYGTGQRKENQINYQQYANNIVVDFTTSTALGARFELDYNTHKTLVPGEVYAIYCRLILKNGTKTKAFHIPGRAPETGETGSPTITTVNSSSLSAYKRFQVQNTGYNASAATNMSYWQNENEVYPDTDDYDSTGLGGEDLRGTPVRHHKIPSLQEIHKNEYSFGGSGLGVQVLAKIQLSISNIVIPSDLNNEIEGIEFFYAKKDIADRCVLGFTPLVYGGQMENPSSAFDDRFVSIPYNFTEDSGGGTDVGTEPNTNYLKTHVLDLLINKPAVSPVFIKKETEYGLSISTTRTGSQSCIIFDDADQKYLWVNHQYSGLSSQDCGDRVETVDSYLYIPENVIFDNIYNRYGEECMLLKGEFANMNSATSPTINDVDSGSAVERSGLISIRQIPFNPHSSFYEAKTLISLGYLVVSTAGTKSTTIDGGEFFISNASIISTAGYKGNDYPVDGDGLSIGLGRMCYRTFLTYSKNLHALRRYDASIKNNEPEIVYNGATIEPILTQYDPTVSLVRDLNQSFTYDNEFNTAVPFNTYETFQSDFYNRIVRFTDLNTNEVNKTIIEYLPNNFYDLAKDNGRIYGIKKSGDTLIIGCEKACYVTRGREVLQLQDVEVYLGTSNIFSNPPKPIIDSDGDYFGCQGKFSMITTNIGAIIVDQNKGKVILYNGQVNDLSKLGMFDYLKQYLRFPPNKYRYTALTSTLDVSGDYLILPITSSNRFLYNIGDLLVIQSTFELGKITKLIQSGTTTYIHTDIPVGSYTAVSTSIALFQLQETVKLCYDVLNNRLLLTRKINSDSLVNRDIFRGFYNATAFASWNNGDTFYYTDNNLRKKSSGVVSNLASSDTADHNFTLSFHLDKMIWVSFHSYVPDDYIIGQDTFYTINNNEIWKHNIKTITSSSLICSFYGTVENSNFTIIINKHPSITKKFKELLWNIPFFFPTGAYTGSNATFNSIDLNSLEVQGVNNKTLTLYSNTPNPGNVRLVHDYWHFNEIRDGSNNKMFGQCLKVKFNYDNSNQYKFYIYEILCKFNYAKN